MVHVETLHQAFALAQVHLEDLTAFRQGGQVQEKDLVEASTAQQFGR
jgi:hypothetical protein